MDSKYFGCVNKFEEDIEAKRVKRIADKKKIKEMLMNKIIENPSEIDRTYRIIIESLIEIKKEFGL